MSFRARRAVPLLTLVAGTTVLALLKIRSPRVPATLPGPRLSSSAVELSVDVAIHELSGQPLGKGAPPDRSAGRVASMLHGDPRHTDRVAARGPRHPQLIWSVAVRGAVEAQPVASPDGATLYVATLGAAGQLLAIERATGHTLWTADLGGRSYATPAVAPNGTVYAASDARRLVAFDPAGHLRWKLEVQGEADTGILLLGGGGGDGGDIAVAAGSHVYRVHSDGTVVWRFDADRKVFTAPARTVADGIVFGAQDHCAYGVAADGRRTFKVDLGADVDGSPVVDEAGVAYFGTDGGAVAAIDGSGALLWKTDLPGFIRGALSLARNGDVLGGMYGPTPAAIRLSPAGHPVGLFPVAGTGAREFGIHGAPLEDETGALFFGAEDDRVYGVGPDGALLWTLERGDDVDAPLTLLPPNDLVVASDDGTVALYREAR